MLKQTMVDSDHGMILSNENNRILINITTWINLYTERNKKLVLKSYILYDFITQHF